MTIYRCTLCKADFSSGPQCAEKAVCPPGFGCKPAPVPTPVKPGWTYEDSDSTVDSFSFHTVIDGWVP